MSWDPFERIQRIIEAVRSAPSIFNTRPCILRGVAADRIEMRFDTSRPAGGALGPATLGGRTEGAVARDGEGPRDDDAGPDGNGLRREDGRRDRWTVPGSLLRPDPLIREEMISCGAALYNLRLAIRVAGHDLSVWLLPDVRRDPTLPASVEIVTARVHPATWGVQELYQAIWLRHTSREPYRILPLPMPLLVEMEDAALQEDGWLRMVHPRQAKHLLDEAKRASDVLWGKQPLAFLSPGEDPLTGVTRLRADARALRDGGDLRGAEVKEWQAEAADRLRRFRDERSQAMRSFADFSDASGVPDVYGPLPADLKRPPTRRDFWTQPPEPFERWRKVQLMALATDDDRPLDWLRAGQALQHAVLTATRYSMSAPYGRSARYQAPIRYGLPVRRFRAASPQTEARYGVAVSPLTQPLELEDIRGEARRWPRWWYRHWPQWINPEPRWMYPEVPQMVLRVGYVPVEPLPAPPLPEVDYTDDRPRPRPR